jgi:hypothetical protein
MKNQERPYESRLTPSQAEGLTIGADGALLIADEAAGGQATLSRYARVP